MAEQMQVWVWMPATVSPAPAGRIDEAGGEVTFTYDESFLARPDAISLYAPELPLRSGRQRPRTGLSAPGCLRDAWPDGWSRVVIERRLRDLGRDSTALTEFDYLRHSSSDRVGNLDFTDLPTWVPRIAGSATLDELQRATELIESGEPIDPSLSDALNQATASGGMRPKALVTDGDKSYVAKLSSPSDTRPVTNIEAVAMDLAAPAGINVAPTRLITIGSGRDVLLVERFDRTGADERIGVVSGSTMLGLDPFLGARYASYHELADILRSESDDPDAASELYKRIIFNVLVGNTDDHARNHAALWDGASLRLSPAFDICPQQRTGNETAQAMEIGRDGFRAANVAGCVERSSDFGVERADAVAIVEDQIDAIRAGFAEAADRARLTSADRDALLGRALLNESVLYGWSRMSRDF